MTAWNIFDSCTGKLLDTVFYLSSMKEDEVYRSEKENWAVSIVVTKEKTS